MNSLPFETLSMRLARILGAGTQRNLYILLTLIVALTWSYIGLGMAGLTLATDAKSLGPGMGVFESLGVDPAGDLAKWLAVICSPLGNEGVGIAGFALITLMWLSASIAMMLPSAAPMITTYGEIAETAAQKGQRVVSPIVLIAGYITVWLLFSGAAAGLQTALAKLGTLSTGLMIESRWLAAIVLIGAGIFQFSALKNACLTKCHAPFPILFAHWSDRPRRIFKLGIGQGMNCLGCCWALMLSMFALGMMNILWMAALAAYTIIEKTTGSMMLSKAMGMFLVFAGIAMIFA